METHLPILAIVGTTGSGKNELAQEVARRTGASLISVDSRKIYRGLNIGTAKPSPEIIREFDYGMIDCADPREYFSAGRYAEMAREIVARRLESGRPVILVGGTGFYLEAFTNGLADLPDVSGETRARLVSEAASRGWESLYEEARTIDPSFMESIHPGDKTRIRRVLESWWETGEKLSELQIRLTLSACPWEVRVIWPELERAEVYNRIEKRVDKMRRAGLTEEVKGLLESGIPSDAPGLATVGYRELVSFFRGEVSEDQAYEAIARNTRRYAKRQITWFSHRGDARRICAQGIAAEDVITIWRGSE